MAPQIKRPKGHFPIQRDDLYDEHVKIKEHATEVGWLLFDWNHLHLTLMELCAQLLKFGDVAPNNPIQAIWHAHKSDSGQREMLRQAAQSMLVFQPVLRDEILWLVTEVDKLAGGRNDATHVPLAIIGVGDSTGWSYRVGPDTVAGPRRGLRLTGKDLLKVFRATRQHTMALEYFARWMMVIHRSRARKEPWPERPVLPEILRDPLPQKSSPKPTGTKRQRPPRS